MAVMLMFFAIGGILWIYSDMSYLSKDILRQFAVAMVLTAGLTFGFVSLVFKNLTYENYLYLAFIPIFIIGIIMLIKKRKIVPLSVVANQQRYWDEIKGSDIYQFFLGRKQAKRKKIAIRVNEGEKKFFKFSELTPEKKYVNISFFKTLKQIEYELTFAKIPNEFLKNEDEDEEKEYEKAIERAMNDAITQIPLYNAVFSKIKFFIKEQDINVDLIKIFEEDKFCVEFFLLDLWERYTKRVNIGTANLILLAQRLIEEEFIGAMDNIDLYSVKSKGAALYYRYMIFMGRVENYLKVDEKELVKEDNSFNDGDYL